MIAGRSGRAQWWFTDRHGGVSAAPFASANLGDHVGDDPSAVGANREHLATRLGVAPSTEWVWLRQVHGATVVDAQRATSEPPEADAAVTTRVGLPLVSCTADCAPIVMVADDVLGVVHAGWKGLVAGVVQQCVATMRTHTDAAIHAVLGPCIHPAAYAFGAVDLERIASSLGDDVVGSTATGDPALDLPTAVRAACALAGVDTFEDVAVCTAASPDHFSHRRDGVTGRQALVAVLV